MRKVLLFLASILLTFIANSQTITNTGKDFWVGYGLVSTMEDGTNTQNMTLYLSVDNLPTGFTYATVIVTIDSSGLSPSLWWKREYHLPANSGLDISSNMTPAFSFSPTSALSSGPLPKGPVDAANSNTSPNFDCRLFSDPCPSGNNSFGLFRKKGIHITSDVDISITAHLYGGVSSGATMLLPTTAWGYSYTTINSKQTDAPNARNFFYIIANEDSTRIQITGSKSPRSSTNCSFTPPIASLPFYVELNKGQIYQYVGQADASGNGVELTSSKIVSVPNATGKTKKIAVFAGSSRTRGEDNCGSGSGRDNDMQQCYPEHSWGKRYATSRFANASSSTNLLTNQLSQGIYKIVAKDTGTLITINGAAAISVPYGSSYTFSNNNDNIIYSNKPISVAQFMSGTCQSGLGDPEMIYLSPMEQAINKAVFFRATKESINAQFVNIIIPDSGIATLRIDGSASPWINAYSYVYNHPYLPLHKIVVIGFPAANTQCVVKSNAKFNAITYGLGAAESYGYSCGAYFENLERSNISGKLISPINKNVNAGVINISGSINSFSQTDINGSYSFDADNGNYTLRPTKNNDITKANGVTSVDALLVQRHILNVAKLNSAYKIIAADVNGDKAINSVDILRIKRLILGTDTIFSSSTKGNRLWEFVDSAYTFPDTTNPFPFKDSISFTNLTSNKINQTFIGVKLGDVNYDWNPAVARGASIDNVELIIDNAAIKVDKQLSTVNYQLPINVKNFKDITAMQYTLHFDNTKYELVNLEGFKNLQGFEYNATKANITGNISMLWTDKNAVERTLEDGTELFVLFLRSKVDRQSSTDLQLTIDNSITDIEAWDKDFNQHNIILTQKSKAATQNNNEVLSVSPNPTNGEVKLDIASKTNKTVKLELNSIEGKKVFEQSIHLIEGANIFTINLKKKANLSTGFYYLKVVGLDGENIKKILVK